MNGGIALSVKGVGRHAPRRFCPERPFSKSREEEFLEPRWLRAGAPNPRRTPARPTGGAPIESREFLTPHAPRSSAHLPRTPPLSARALGSRPARDRSPLDRETSVARVLHNYTQHKGHDSRPRIGSGEAPFCSSSPAPLPHSSAGSLNTGAAREGRLLAGAGLHWTPELGQRSGTGTPARCLPTSPPLPLSPPPPSPFHCYEGF